MKMLKRVSANLIKMATSTVGKQSHRDKQNQNAALIPIPTQTLAF